MEDSWISGLAPLGKELLVLLTVPKEREENGDAARPQGRGSIKPRKKSSYRLTHQVSENLPLTLI